jgi:hypothetical protein
MSEIPDNVDLNWIRQTLLALRDDMKVMATIVRRLDNARTSFHDETRALFDLHRNLRERVDAIEIGKK